MRDLSAIDTLDNPVQALPDPEALLAASRAAEAKGDYASAIALARQAEAAARERQLPAQEAASCRLLAAQLVHDAEPEAAARACERACKLYEDLGNQSDLCECLIELSLIYINLGLHDEALDAVTRSLNIAILREDKRLMFWAYNRTGVVYHTLDDPLQANEFMLAGLALAAGLGVDENFCIQNNLAYNAPDLVKKYHDYGQPREADTFLRRGVSHARQALTLAGDGKHPYREGIAHDNLAMLLALQGDFAEADEHFTRAASLAATHGFADLAIATAHYRARAALLRGDLPVGIAGLQRVLEQAKAKNQKPIIASVNLQLAEAYERAEQPVLALAHYKAFHEAERSFNTTVAQTRSNMLSNMFELENSRLEAERARLEAELLRGRSAGLEAEMQQLQTQMEELNRHAQQDALTGLWNRRYLDNQLPKLFERMKQANTPVCLAMADIDFFKSVNDRFGHPVGDQVLVRTARLLLRGARQMDIVARFGGEEFLLVFAGLAPEAAAAACEKLRLAVAEYDWGQIHPALRVTISLGLACGPAADFAAAVVAADRLLYEAKQGGRNTIKLG